MGQNFVSVSKIISFCKRGLPQIETCSPIAKWVPARKTTCLKQKPAMKARILFDQMKVSERRTESKNWNEVISTIKKKPRQFHRIKSNKEVTPKTRETYFLHRKPQKLKIAKHVFQKTLSKSYWKFSLFSASRVVPKNEKRPAIAEIISSGFPLKWAKMNHSFPTSNFFAFL